ncbi:MAG: peptidoglycan D,D-transpeptidase FtsI family protein [Candidatus Promineifilaceae bacterium]
MESNQSGRLWVVIAGMTAAMLLLIFRVGWFQIIRADDLIAAGDQIMQRRDSVTPDRGYIFDKHGSILAAPGNDYELGVDLPLMTEAENFALDLVPILQQLSYQEILTKMEDGNVASGGRYAHLSNRIDAAQVEQIRLLEEKYNGINVNPIPRRLYPQGELMCHVLGYVDFDNIGGAGVEGFLNAELAGEAVSRQYLNIPSTPREELNARMGRDLVLTIDRTVQSTVERHLREALAEHGAESGSIVVMDPKSGAILAMANDPCYDPYEYFKTDNEETLTNPSVSQQYEPGSVMKLVTMAMGLDSGAVRPDTIYPDTGILMLDGAPIRNAENGSYGPIDMTQTLVWSVNTATSWVATRHEPDVFYGYMEKFGFGRPTGVDLANEINGLVPEPTQFGWTLGTLARNAFGQSISVTPLQMLSAISALANEGKQMRPHVVKEMWEDGDQVYEAQPIAVSEPVSADAARTLTNMAIRVGAHYMEIDGYTVAGKTGTAQIPVIPEDGGAAFYHPTETIASFVGWMPADDPVVSIIVKLDVPTKSQWGSETAAPAFEKLARELIVLLDIPPDAVRLSTR